MGGLPPGPQLGLIPQRPLEHQPEGVSQPPARSAAQTEVDGRLGCTVHASGEKAEVVEVVGDVPVQVPGQPEDAEGQAAEEKEKDGQEDQGSEATGLVSLRTMLHPQQEQQAGHTHGTAQCSQQGCQHHPQCPAQVAAGFPKEQGAGPSEQQVQKQAERPDERTYIGGHVAWAAAQVPGREERGQALLHADGCQQAQAYDVAEETECGQDGLDGTWEAQLARQQVRDDSHHVAAEEDEVCAGHVQEVDGEGVPEGIADKQPEDHAIAQQSTQAEELSEGQDGQVEGHILLDAVGEARLPWGFFQLHHQPSVRSVGGREAECLLGFLSLAPLVYPQGTVLPGPPSAG